MNDSTVRTAASVSRLLRKHGIKTGYRYTQTGYVDSKGQPFSRPGVMVSRMVHSRYDSEVEDDAVSVYLVADEDGKVSDPMLATMVYAVLEAEGIPFVSKGSTTFRIPDEPGLETYSDQVLLKTFASLTHQIDAAERRGPGGHALTLEREARAADLRARRDLAETEILKRMGS